MSAERFVIRQKHKYSFQFLALGINLLIIYLVYPASTLALVSITSFTLSIAFFLRDVLKHSEKGKNNKIDIKYSPSIVDNFKTAIQYFNVNKKVILATSAGLILSLLVISQSILVDASFSQNSYDRYMMNKDQTALNIHMSQVDNSTFNDWNSLFVKNAKKWFSTQNLQVTSLYSEGNLKIGLFMGHTYNFDIGVYQRYAHTWPLLTSQWNKNIYGLYSNLPSFSGFAFNPNESILVLPPVLSVFTESIPKMFYYNPDDFMIYNSSGVFFRILVNAPVLNNIYTADTPWNFNNITYKTDRVWQLTEDDLAYIRYNGLTFPYLFGLGNFYLPHGEEWSLYNTLQSKVLQFNETSYIWGEVGLSSYAYIKIPQLKDVSVTSLENKLNHVIQTATADSSGFLQTYTTYTDQSTIPYQLSSQLLILVTQYKDNLLDLNHILLLSLIPMAVVPLFLLYFSLSLIHKRKRKILKLLKIRGSSDFQVGFAIGLEILILSLFSTIVAALVSTSTVGYIMQSSGIFQFQGEKISVIIPNAFWIKIMALGILLGINFNLPNIRSDLDSDIEDQRYDIESENFILRHNIDLGIFLLCVIYWIVILYLPLPQSAIDLGYTIFGKWIFFLSILSLPIVIGRYFVIALNELFLRTRSFFDLFYLALRNLKNNRKLVYQLIALLIASMMLCYSSIILTNTMTKYEKERSLYHLGSEIVVENVGFDQIMLHNLTKMPEIQSYTTVSYVQYVPRENEVPIGITHELWTNTYFLGIDPTSFANASYWNNNYAGVSLGDLMKNLESTPGGMIIQSDFAKILDLHRNSTFNFQYGYRAQSIYHFNVSNVVNYFPRIFTEHPKLNENNLLVSNYIITTQDRLNQILDVIDYLRSHDDETNQLVYVKPIQGTNLHNLSLMLNSLFYPTYEKVIVKDYLSEQKPFLQETSTTGLASTEEKILRISIQISIVVAVIMYLLGIFYYSFLFINERLQEVGIYRAFGMTKKQIRKVFFYELLIIMLTAIAFGIVFSEIFSYLAILVLLNGNVFAIPPFQMNYQFNVIITLTSIIAGICLVIGYIPILISSRKHTINILRTF